MTIGELWRRVVHLVRGSSADDDLREEMALHVELRAHAMRRSGTPADGAEFAARKQFGNQTVLRAESRDPWGFAWVEQGMRDLRYAVRRLAQRPGFALAVISVLALGIGATTAMFSAVDAAMLRPLPFPDPSRLVLLKEVDVPFDPGREQRNLVPGPGHGVSVSDIAAMPDLFSHVAVYAAGGLNLADPSHPVRVKAGVVSTDFFGTIGIAPEVGRTFIAAEGVPSGPSVVVLSFGLWQRLYAGRDVLNSILTLNNASYTVIGVMPRGFNFPSESDLWIPMSLPNTFATFSAFRGFLGTDVIARVAPGVDMRAAAARLTDRWNQVALAETPLPGGSRLGSERAHEVRKRGAFAPLKQELVGDQRTGLLVLLGATALLLLIACANVTNLLLSHAAARRHEIAVRAVLGASRGRIVRQLLTESAVLACTGAALGVAFAPVILNALGVLMPPKLAGVAPAHIDWRVLSFAATLALITGIGFGLWPALGTTREAPAETIKSGGRSATSSGAARARRILAGAELSLTLVLLIGSGLMLRSFQRVMELSTGMDTGQTGTLEVVFPVISGGRASRLREIDDILARLSATPGVIAAGIVNDLPMRSGGGIALRVKIETAPHPDGDDNFVRSLTASRGYFTALGIALRHGRTFAATDDSLAPHVVLINQSMAKAYWGDADPVGATFTIFGPKPITVIGIVSDVRETYRLGKIAPQMYSPAAYDIPNNLAIVARGTMPPKVLLARMTQAVRAVDPSQAVSNVRMMDEVVSNSLAPRRANTLLISAFAILALILSALGVYAVVSYSVAQRTRELGIRAALGATGRDLITLVAGEMAWVTVVGIAVGIGGAWALSKVLASMLFSVDIHDALTFTLVPVAIAVPAVVAALVPAWRAARVNPADVMRAD